MLIILEHINRKNSQTILNNKSYLVFDVSVPSNSILVNTIII